MKKYDQHKMMKGRARVNQLEAGFFDGRFVSRVEQPKTIYIRTVKHKNKGYE
jgi:stalled ribosome alternative rescue factor ArfA|tara:strand:- start:218 stop:373 length:156 start_codon:yes stop_codon:yes gene_type:complete